jgi:uncharacterized protein YkwD
MLYLYLLFSVLAQPISHTGPEPKPRQAHLRSFDATPVNKKLLLDLVNEAREKGCTCGETWYAPVPPLQWNEALEKAAVEHSRDMDQKNYFSHISPDGSDAGSRILDAGYNWKNYGENIGMGYHNEQEVVNGWLHSPGHCKNIMNKTYKDMGVGRSGNYWTQDLGSR